MPIDMAPPVSVSPLAQIQPPQSENLLDTAQRMAALRMAPLQQQAMQKQITGYDLANQESQMAIQSQQGLMKAFVAANGNPDTVAEIAPRYGVLPKDVMGWRASLLNMAKERGEVDKNTQDLLDAWHDTLHNAYAPVLEESDPTKQAQMMAQINQGLLQRYPQKQASDLLPWSGPDNLKLAMAAYTTDKWLTAQGAVERGNAAAKQADTAAAKAAAVRPGEQAASDQAQRANTAAVLGAIAPGAGARAAYDQARDAYLQGGGNPAVFPPSAAAFDEGGRWQPNMQQIVQRAGMTTEQRTQADLAGQPKTEAELAAVATDPAKSAGDRAAAVAALGRLDQSRMASRPVTNVSVVPGTPQVNGTQLHGDDYLKTITGANGVTAAMVKAIDDGKSWLPSANARVSNGPALRAAVFQYNPSFDEANMPARMQTLKEFTNTSNGKAGGQVLALNTLIHHADLYQQTADALKNGTWRPGNAAYNAVANLFGSAPPTQANLVARFLASETGKVASGGVPAESEINGVLKNLGSDASPDQIAGAGRTLLQIAAGRMIPLQERVAQNNLQKQVQVLGPDARDILQRRGYDPNTLKPVSPQPAGSAPLKIGDTRIYQGATYKFDGRQWVRQ